MSNEQQQDEIEDRGDVVAIPEADVDSPAAEAPAAEPEPPKPDREALIPRSRFDEINERLREERQARQDERQARLDAEARLREASAPKPPPFDLRAAEKEYLDAVNEGDRDKAADLWNKIREHERHQHTAQMTATLKAEVEQARAQVQLEVMAETLVEKYPFLDPAGETANPAAIKEVVEWRDYYIAAKKLSPAQALKQAVSRVVPNYTQTPTPSGTGIAAGMDRTTAQKAANAKAAAALPPNTAQMGVGERALRPEKLDVAKMTDKEFSALSEDERAKLRGDAVT